MCVLPYAATARLKAVMSLGAGNDSPLLTSFRHVAQLPHSMASCFKAL